MDPGKQDRADGIEFIFGNSLFGPDVILHRADDEFDFVSGFEVSNIFPAIALDLATTGAFQIHDAMHARVDAGDIVRAAGFEQDDEAVVAKFLHQWQDVFLKEGFAAGQLDQRKGRGARVEGWHAIVEGRFGKRLGEAGDFGVNFFQGLFFAFSKGVGGIAIGAAEIAGGQADKNAGEAGEGAFALQAQVDFIDD